MLPWSCDSRPASLISRFSLSLILISISILPSLPAAAQTGGPSPQQHFGEICFAIADERNLGPLDPDNDSDTLTSLDPKTGITKLIGETLTDNIEAMSFGPGLKIYAANGGQLGTVDPQSGVFTALPSPIGKALKGSIGQFDIGDVDGLAFSLDRNILFGTQRRFDGFAVGPQPDFLFAIDPTTGALIHNYFGPENGPKTDYVIVPPVLDDEGNSLTDIDDIQFDPVSGELYAAMDTDGRSGVLVKIDVDTGIATTIATMHLASNNEIIDDIEGISFANDGTLYASTGDNYIGDDDDLNRLFKIDPTTGKGTLIGAFPTGSKDYEAVACLSREAAVVLRKYTNGAGQAPEDADDPTGPYIEAGGVVTWTYTFTNTGVLTLTDMSLVDDQLGDIDLDAATCIPPGTTLAPGASRTCIVTGTAQVGQYANVATISGTTESDTGFPVQTVTDTNPSHYFGALPGIEIIKFTNGEDADDPTGPYIEVGDVVTWTYVVSNTGNVPLSSVTVADNVPGVSPQYVSGDDNGNSLLDPGELWLFRATGEAVEGQYTNIGTVTDTPPVGEVVTDTNPSNYFGSSPGIEIIKFTNGEDADTPPGPEIDEGDPVTWTYEVRNTGNVPLSNIVVVDNVPGVSPDYVSGDDNGNDLLDLDEVWLYQATGIAIEGPYNNIGTVTGTPPVGPNVSDDNPSNYFGNDAGPTNLPTDEQPQQQRSLYLPSLQSEE